MSPPTILFRHHLEEEADIEVEVEDTMIGDKKLKITRFMILKEEVEAVNIPLLTDTSKKTSPILSVLDVIGMAIIIMNVTQI